jgi:hypothetical protein
MSRIFVILAAGLFLTGCASLLGGSASFIPFDPRSNQVTISASANGVPLRFLVDTAVDPSAIDRRAAFAAGLKKLGKDEAIEGVGSDAATAYPSVIPSLDIAGRIYGPIEVLVNDMSKIRARYGAPLDGILGYSLLKDHAVLIDYPANRIALFEGAASTEPRGCRTVHRFPLRFRSDDDRSILVPGLAIGGIQIPAFLDTGSSNSLRIDVDAPSITSIRRMLPQGEAGTSVGARGEAHLRRGTLEVPVTLGPFRVDHADVSMVRESSPDLPVNIGNRFLRALGAKLLVDIPGRKVAIYGECAV